MGNIFLTREDVIQAFSMDKNITNDDILKILKEKIKECHPDKIEGREEEAIKITSAINYLNKLSQEEQHGGMLVPIQALSQTVIKLSEEITKIAQVNNYTSLEQRADMFSKSYRSTMTIPAISSSAILGILSFLFFFPKTILENPLIENLSIEFSKSILLILWVCAISFTIMSWILKFRQESRLRNAITLLTLENNRNIFLDNFLKLKTLAIIEKNKIEKTKNSDLKIYFFNVDFLIFACYSALQINLEIHRDQYYHIFDDPNFRETPLYKELKNSEVINNLIQMTLDKATNKGLLSKVDDELLYDKYIINKNYINKYLQYY